MSVLHGEIDRQVVTTIHHWVKGAPPITRRYAPSITIDPEKVTVIYRDGEVAKVTVTGRRILQSSLRRGLESDEPFYKYELGDARTTIPEWLWPFFRRLEDLP